MQKITGKYNTATIYSDVFDKDAENQIKALCDFYAFKESKIRIMPDVHAGTGCTIGTTMTVIDKLSPNLVGVDIGCGIETVVLNDKKIDFEKLDSFIYKNIPSGNNVREKIHGYYSKFDIQNLKCIKNIDLSGIKESIGTLGSGNHFIEIDKDKNGNLYLIVHTGSRSLGRKTAQFYQNEAIKQRRHFYEKNLTDVIEQSNLSGDKLLIKARIKKIKTEFMQMPKYLAYLENEQLDNYLYDMKIIQQYAELNRKAITDDILMGLNLTPVERFSTIHNYIDIDSMILRKGAISAKKGEKILIPINMRDGSIIATGKGNKEWNYSAPHGAGRLFGRNISKSLFNMDDYNNSMRGIYTTSVNENTLDECPMAYKNINDIIDKIYPTAEINKILKPVYNFKSS